VKKRRSLLFGVAVGLALGWAGTASIAQDEAVPELSTKLDIAYVSKYVWRGIPQTSEGAVQPSLTLSHSSGLSLNFWASEDVDRGKFTEHDYTVNYAWDTQGLAMNAGYIYYAFPNTSYPSTSEIYYSVCFGGLLSPTFSVNYDINEAKGFYAGLAVGYCCPVALSKMSTSLSLGAKLSYSNSRYNAFWFGKDKSGLADLYLTASMPFSVGKASVTPSLSYYTIVDDALSDGLSGMGLKSNNFVGGLTASYAF